MVDRRYAANESEGSEMVRVALSWRPFEYPSCVRVQFGFPTLDGMELMHHGSTDAVRKRCSALCARLRVGQFTHTVLREWAGRASRWAGRVSSCREWFYGVSAETGQSLWVPFRKSHGGAGRESLMCVPARNVTRACA